MMLNDLEDVCCTTRPEPWLMSRSRVDSGSAY